jgi:hypothetical protein
MLRAAFVAGLLCLFLMCPPDVSRADLACMYVLSTPDRARVECLLLQYEYEYFFEFEKYGVDYKKIMTALAWRESKFRENLITEENGGKDYSVGFWQIRVDTAQYFFKRWRDSKGKILIALQGGEYNCLVASEYFLSKLRKYKTIELAIAAYNSGRPKYDKLGRLINADYVADVMGFYSK